MFVWTSCNSPDSLVRSTRSATPRASSRARTRRPRACRGTSCPSSRAAPSPPNTVDFFFPLALVTFMLLLLLPFFNVKATFNPHLALPPRRREHGLHPVHRVGRLPLGEALGLARGTAGTTPHPSDAQGPHRGRHVPHPHRACHKPHSAAGGPFTFKRTSSPPPPSSPFPFHSLPSDFTSMITISLLLLLLLLLLITHISSKSVLWLLFKVENTNPRLALD